MNAAFHYGDTMKKWASVMQGKENYPFTFLTHSDSYLSCQHPRPPELSNKWSEIKESCRVNSVK